MPQYKLYYFDVRGRGELIRLIFAYAQVPYEDFRFQGDQWIEHKPSKFSSNPCEDFNSQYTHIYIYVYIFK